MNTIDVKERNESVTKYVIDHYGVIKQLYPKPFVYDNAYITDVYCRPDYLQRSSALQQLRLGFVLASWQRGRDSAIQPGILDVGFGNGHFISLAHASTDVSNTYCSDVTLLPTPIGVTRIPTDQWQTMPVNIITMWDVIEHFPDLSFLAHLNADMLVVSTPWCHTLYYEVTPHRIDPRAIDYLTNWHHRKPNEHLHLFNDRSLVAMMSAYGWKPVSKPNNLEDLVRHSRDGLSNILSCAFVRM